LESRARSWRARNASPAVPEVVEKLIKLGFAVAVESGAGDAANCDDDSYRAAGAQIIDGAAALWAASDIVFKVGVPTSDEVGLLRQGGTLIGYVWPAQNPDLMQQLAGKRPPYWPLTPCRGNSPGRRRWTR
jgi:NAD(P) transhydrogenase subunit alpha